MNIDEIKRNYTAALMNAITEPDKSGRGYVCPLCGSGTGKNGTGLTPVKGRPGYFHCFAACCEFHGDVLELIGAVYHLNETAEQIEKAGELLHMNFKERDARPPWTSAAPERDAEPITQYEADKNTTETNKEQRERITAFINDAAVALRTSEAGLAYLKARGLSYDIAIKKSLGYTDKYGDGMNTPALIIPTGPDSYTARSITANDNRKIRKQKAGERAGIFNISCLDNPQLITFITEGEIDALSVLECGYQAIATGGGTGKRALVEALRQRGKIETEFIILPDNDRLESGDPDFSKGYKMGSDLQAMLKEAGIKATLFETWLPEKWPAAYKDINDFLVNDRKGCRDFLAVIMDRRESALLGRTSGFLQGFINHINGNTPPISTGFRNLDGLLEGGLHAGLVVIGAVSALGKTTFCLNMADLMAEAGQDVLFFSLEMSRYELISKVISRRTAEKCLKENLPLQMAKSNLGISDFNRWASYPARDINFIKDTFREYESGAARNFYIKEGLRNIGTAEIRRAIQTHINVTRRRPVVIIDYLQIMASPDNRMTDKQKTDANIVEAKRISRDFGIPVIGISSFNRENYYAPVSMAAFKESGALEYTSDVLIGLQYDGMEMLPGEKERDRAERLRAIMAENEANARGGRGVPIELRILKNRSGSKGACGFNYFPMFNLYTEA